MTLPKFAERRPLPINADLTRGLGSTVLVTETLAPELMEVAIPEQRTAPLYRIVSMATNEPEVGFSARRIEARSVAVRYRGDKH